MAQSEKGGRAAPAYTTGLTPLTVEELLDRQFDPPEYVLAPWLPTQGITLLYAPRGIGKTHVSVGTAVAVATGTCFLRWSASRPRCVIFIDGEMPGHMLQERFARAIEQANAEVDPENLKIAAADLEPDGLPDLAHPESQQYYETIIDPAELVIVDNLSTICRSLRENDADSWGVVQDWALSLRRRGKSVLFVHHSGKSGDQRGTSRKEDVMNSVISLKRPPDYSPTEGARFEVHFTKHRGFFGPDAEPFEAWLRDNIWQEGPITRSDDTESLRSLRDEGMSLREIEERTGVSKSTVQRRLKELDL